MGILGAIAVASAVGGAVVKAKAEKDLAKAEIARLKFNAAIADKEARQKRRALLEEQHIRKENARRTIETQRVALAGQGTTLSGSSLTVLLQSAEDMALDIEAISKERETIVQKLANKASIFRTEAKQTRDAGRLSVATTLLGGASKAFTLGSSLSN